MNVMLTVGPDDFEHLPYRILSILKTTPHPIHFYILSEFYYSRRLEYQEIDYEPLQRLGGMCAAYHGSTVQWMRLLLNSGEEDFLTQAPSHLPPEIDHILYLDRNTYINGNLAGLWDTRLTPEKPVVAPKNGNRFDVHAILFNPVEVRAQNIDLVHLMAANVSPMSYRHYFVMNLPKFADATDFVNSMQGTGGTSDCTSALWYYRRPTWGTPEEPIFLQLRKTLQQEVDSYKPLPLPSVDADFEHRFENHKDLESASFRRWKPMGPMPEFVQEFFTSQMESQSTFFELPPPPMYLWVVFGGSTDITEFLAYYSQICPVGTRAIFLLDRDIPNVEELKTRISECWLTLFFEIPSSVTEAGFDAIRIWIFREIYPTRLGTASWNAFLDCDEFIPLPTGMTMLGPLLDLMKEKNIQQLHSVMLDVWELRDKSGAVGEYISLPKGQGLNAKLEPTYFPSSTWFSPLTEDEFFLRSDGDPIRFYNEVRMDLLAYGPECANKTVLIWGDATAKYSDSSHHPHKHFSSISEAYLRYPLIHMKFLRSQYKPALKKFVGRLSQMVPEFYREDTARYLARLSELVTSPEDGIGPFNILSSNTDEKVLAEFGQYLKPLSSVVDSSYHFSLEENPFSKKLTPSFFPVINLDPLFPDASN